MKTFTVKVMVIDDMLSEYKNLVKVESFKKTNMEYKFNFVNQAPFYFNNKDINQFENIEKAIDNAIQKENVDILIFDLSLNGEDDQIIIQHPGIKITNWINLSSIRLAKKYTDSVKLILFISTYPQMDTVGKFKALRKNNSNIFNEKWGYIPRFRFDINNDEIDVKPCPDRCGDEKAYSYNSPCRSIECAYWQLVHQYRNAKEKEK